MDLDRPGLLFRQARLIPRRTLLAMLGASAAAGLASPILALGISDDDEDERERRRRQKRKKKELPDVPVAVIAPLLGLVGFGGYLALKRRRERLTRE